MARLRVEPMDVKGGTPVPLPIAELSARLKELHYDGFEELWHDDHGADFECGFRWSPPFEKLLSVSADFHVNLRCLYEDDGTGFMGAWRAKDGKVVQDDCIGY